MIKISELKKTDAQNVRRLAKWLRLKTQGMSISQIIKLVKWRVSRGISQRH